MTTMIIKDSFRSAFSRPIFLILLVITLLMAPASAFASGDDSTADDSSLAADQTEPTDQSGGSEESTSTEQFESPTVYEQDATASSGDIDAGLPEAATSPSQPDDQSKPAEVIASAQTETADTETGLYGTSDTGGNDPTGEQEFAPLETVGTATDNYPVDKAKTTTLYFQVQEVSMSPLLNPGSIIEIVSETYADGDMVMAQKSDGTYIVKVLNGDQLVPLGAGERYNAADVIILGAAALSSLAVEDLELSGLSWGSVLAETSTLPTAGDGTSGSPYEIAIWENLYWLSQSSSVWGEHFIQTADILFPGDPVTKNDGIYLWDSSKGWLPIGTFATPFSGTYDGNGFKISNLFINRPTADYIGLFGYTVGTMALKNITLENINVTGRDRVGGLVGYNYGNISNSCASGTVVGTNVVGGGLVGSNEGTISDSSTSVAVVGVKYVGGLVGYNGGLGGGTISNSHAEGAVSGTDYVGGLVGYNYGTISNSYAEGAVSGTNVVEDIGGLVGYNYGTISNSYATGTVTRSVADHSSERVGGLVGSNIGQITNSYAEGAVSGVYRVGGLVGYNDEKGTISNSYASGSVSGFYVGGLVGYNYGTISNSYAAGKVSGAFYGGLVGRKYGDTISNSYWDTVTSEQATSDGGVGKSTDDMQKMETFENWSISDQGGESTIWRIYEGSTYPLLRNFFTEKATITITADNKTYDGNTSLINGRYTIQDGKDTSYVHTTLPVTYHAASKNAGEDEIILRGVYSNQLEYDLIFVSPTFTITARPITVTAVSDTRVYDGTRGSAGVPTITSANKLADGDTATWTQSFDTKNVGTGKTITPAGTVNDGNSGNNYVVTFVNDTTGVISTLAINVTAATDTKVYDDTTDSAGVPTITSVNILIGGDTATWTQSFDTKNVGTGKTITPAGTVNDGNSGNNYDVTFASDTAGVITARSLNLSSFVADDKEYDGTTAVLSGAGFNDDRVAGDALTFNYTVAFEDKNVGTDKDVNFTGIAISGGLDQNNYTLVTTSGVALADITARNLTLSNFDADSKVYDGTTDVTGAGFNDDRIAGDVLTFSYNAAFLDKNVGTGKNVNFTGIVISGGADAGNYNLLTTSGTDTADITPKSLVITATDITKLYYSIYTFTGTEFSTVGLVSGDEVTFADITSAGAPKTVLPGDYVISIGNAVGTGLSNYDITYVEGKMSVVLPMFDSYDSSFLVTTPAFLGNKALTGITGEAAAHITPAFISSGNQFDLAQAVLAYQEALQRYEEEKELLTDVQRALFETELAVARAAILAMEARLLATEGLPYNLAALQAAYAEAVASLNAHQGSLSAGQLAAANQLLAAIAGVIAALQQINA